MENHAIQVIDEIVLIKEVTFANFIAEARTGTMTFIRPDDGEEIHCEFIDKDRKIAKAITELPTEVSFRIRMKYRFLINDGTMLIDVVDAYLNNDFRINVYRGYLMMTSTEIDEKGGFKIGWIHTRTDYTEDINTDEVSEEGSDIFTVYDKSVYDAMTFFIHMIHCTNRQSPVLILYHEVGMRKSILSFKFTDDGNEKDKDKELFNTINSTDYRLSTYCESDGTVLPKFNYYMDGKIDGIHFYPTEEGPLMILSLQGKSNGSCRIKITNHTAIDYFMCHAMSSSQMPHRFYIHEDNKLLLYQPIDKRCYAIDAIPLDEYEKEDEE